MHGIEKFGSKWYNYCMCFIPEIRKEDEKMDEIMISYDLMKSGVGVVVPLIIFGGLYHIAKPTSAL